MPYIPHTPEEIAAMLEIVGAQSVEELFIDIPAALGPARFDLPTGLSEQGALAKLERLARKNRTDRVSFLGGGVYDHFIPKAVDALTSRGEFYTAYTPYQPEAAQGTLTAIFEYQTMIARLVELDCANAGVYDGGSALFESLMAAIRATRRTRLVVDESVSPIHRTMLASYTANLDLDLTVVPQRDGVSDLAALMAAVDDKTAAVAVQNPNFFGVVEDFSSLFSHAKSKGALGIIGVYPVMQAVLKTPGEMGADFAYAEGQSLGLPMSFGGPYLGVMACRKELIRQMPGRIAGKTADAKGREGFVLTLQAREQHIRRAKATSNICSNQALCALRAVVHASLLGPVGLDRTARLSMERARLLKSRLCSIPGVRPLNNQPFANEFAVCLPIPAMEFVDALSEKGFVPGFPLGRYFADMDDALLCACTEKHDPTDLCVMAELAAGILRGRA